MVLVAACGNEVSCCLLLLLNWTFTTFERPRDEFIPSVLHAARYDFGRGLDFAAPAALKAASSGALAELPARSPLPAKLVPARALDAVQIQSAWQSAGRLRAAWLRPFPHSSWNYQNMSPAGTREQDRVETGEPSRSAARGSSEARRCEDVNSAPKQVVYSRARRTRSCSILL